MKIGKYLAGLIALVMVLAACAPPAAPAEEGMAMEEDMAMADAMLPADAADEQVLRIATGSTGANSFTFYPMSGGGDHQSWMPLLYVPPLYFDVDAQLQYGVFDSAASSEGDTVWTFTIDARAKWSDGTPITAQQVVGTWNRMTDPLTEHGRIPQYIGNVQGFPEARADEADTVSGLAALDDRTVQATLAVPDSIFHWRIATTHTNPIKIDDVTDENLDAFWLPENNPAVSGPYMLTEYDPDLGVATMEPNPHWWMDEGPYLERIEFMFVTDQNTAATMVQNDQVNFAMTGLPPALRAAHPDYFRPVKSIGFNSFWITDQREPTHDPKVREALYLAVDIEAVFQAAFPEGNAMLPTQLLDPNVSCWDPDANWSDDYDPEAARAALAASSYGSAENLPKIRVTPRASAPTLNRALEAVMEFWRQNLGVTNVEFKTRPDEYGEDADLVNLSRDDVVIRFPDGATYAWVGMHSAGPIARGSMLKGYRNPEVDRLIEEAQALPPEDPGRCEKTRAAQEFFMADRVGIFFGIPEGYGSVGEEVASFERGPDVGLIAPWRIYLRQ